MGIVGVGALGSVLATGMSRLGLDELILVDSDRLAPGNLVRHEAPSPFVEEFKAESLKVLVEPLFARQRVTTLTRDVVTQWDEVGKELGRCNVVIDATGNQAVHELLGGSSELKGTGVVWAYVKPGPQFGLLALKHPGSLRNLLQLEEALASHTDRWDEFVNSGEQELIWPEPGCYDPTFRAPFYRMRMMADGFLAALLDWIEAGMTRDHVILLEQRDAEIGLEQRVLCHVPLD